MLTPQLELGAFHDVPFPVATCKELKRERMLRVEAMGRTLCVLWNHGRPRVFEDQCAHLGLPLSMGTVEPRGVRCAYHGWLFDADTGEVCDQPTLTRTRRCSLKRFGALVAGGLVFCWLGDPGDEEAVRARLPEEVLEDFSLYRVEFECPFYLALFSSVDYAHFAFHRGYSPFYKLYGALRSNAHVPGSAFSSRVVHEDDRKVTVRLEPADREVRMYASAAEMDDRSINYFQTFVTPLSPTRTLYWECYTARTRNPMLKLLSKLAFRTLTVRLLEDEDRVWTGASAQAFLAGDNINMCENDLPLGQHLRKFVAPRLKAWSAKQEARDDSEGGSAAVGSAQ
ncbi:MAG: hypothetical protein CMP23_04780 [Rickettsiales bacterium]|nr:hypothetical protein [Rickettsiales bacterium]|tara:strand:+ start:203 stop:1222 length:1020 start_codon:yes stop_codon:yes gene_type:complete